MQLTLETRNESYRLKQPTIGSDEEMVLNAIRELGKADLHQLMERTGLDKSAVSARRNALAEKKLIRSTEKRMGREGRPVAVFEIA